MKVTTETNVYRGTDDRYSGTDVVTIEIAGVRINIYEFAPDQVVIEADSDGQYAENVVRVRIDDMEVYR